MVRNKKKSKGRQLTAALIWPPALPVAVISLPAKEKKDQKFTKRRAAGPAPENVPRKKKQKGRKGKGGRKGAAPATESLWEVDSPGACLS